MNTKRFVSGSSIILAGWLAATFLNDVPAQRYPKLDKKTADTGVKVQSSATLVAAAKRIPVTVAR
jgi:hypothetical protein